MSIQIAFCHGSGTSNSFPDCALVLFFMVRLTRFYEHFQIYPADISDIQEFVEYVRYLVRYVVRSVIILLLSV